MLYTGLHCHKYCERVVWEPRFAAGVCNTHIVAEEESELQPK